MKENLTNCEETKLFEVEVLESRELFAAVALPHHMMINMPGEFLTQPHNLNHSPVLHTQVSTPLSDPSTSQLPVYLQLTIGGPQAALQIGELNLAKDLQPLLSGVNGVLNVVTGLTNDLLSPLLISVLSII
ncbi:hypothetical protein A7K93_09225 [Candidatus Methylacidiphilum fumarolicum]|uniref:Uncharacterized protein n=2 Tax=Candidatus Methylacidiphilum fumarolicum TaxID=591154 RepID=I0JZE8_METFB|nr:hypothetical protein [Candidatus Methylacidiphilum fumarolicum]MBW6415776.1 hypothetical protein [Candidatus Methylacidiphilum fumarolicum]TFE66833.1 hypothetical protein A7K73_09760 [Candidatus Methylacidiphilum fumarolicum]TFE72272.1 hypothetical protein A7K93_09225 [Candidatus Methylacidiphilum fumarolicum]TFE72489.1 hypothetical protein A7K72_08530 [Candidatus Methylacidiphilum fumarolicum]TFE77662.1 hypothetical protein A7D33_03660 [Candidatus Methylacidiphilum fumarolicum]